MTLQATDDLIERAARFAAKVHHDQKRKYTGEPYFVHLHEVAQICARHGCSKRAIAAAYLHDTIEDQPVSYEELRREFGSELRDIVYDLTDVPVSAGNRKARKEMDRIRLSFASADAQTIKCADLISNTASIVSHDPEFARVYLLEKRAMLDVLMRAYPTLHALAMRSLVEAEDRLGVLESTG